MKKFILFLIAAVNIICAQSVTDGLIAYYPFSGNADDAWVGGYNGTIYNWADFTPDRYGNENSSYRTAGTGSYFTIPMSKTLMGNSYTVSFWAKIDQRTAYSVFVFYENDNNNNYKVHLVGENGSLSFHLQDLNEATQTRVGLPPPVFSMWKHITVTYNSGNWKYYIDGSLETEAFKTISQLSYSKMYWCTHQPITGAYDMSGCIDDIQVFNRAVTPVEVKKLYANYLPPAGLAGFAEQGQNVLSWDMSGYADIQKIKIYRNGVFYDEITVDGAEDSLYHDRHVLPGTAYDYSISSVDIYDNESIKTNPVYVTAAEITFTDINAELPGLFGSSSAWGDYDNDGDLDILLTGYAGASYNSNIYRNDSGIFTNINAGLQGVTSGSAAWGDYDNDGDIDLLLTGFNGSSAIARIYRNDSGTFTDINAGLQGIYYSSCAWGDYDNDGDLDILLTGSIGSGYISRIYRNDSGVFTDINAGLPGLDFSSVDWGDFDNDGDLDILLTGINNDPLRISRIYRNDSGVFTDINAGLTGVFIGSAKWGDFDNDGDLDIALIGDSGPGFVFKIFRNDSGIFTGSDVEPSGLTNGTVDWGDYDNDGDLDILLNGATVYGSPIDPVTRIYRNDSGLFTNINAGLSGVYWGASSWGDFDNDGDLDMVLTGDTTAGYLSKIYRNNAAVSNAAPGAPANLRGEINDTVLTINWDVATDPETPQSGLSYNIHVDNNGKCRNSSMSDILTGYRKIVKRGNASQNNSYSLNSDFFKLPALPQEVQVLTVKVQTIDNCLAGSEFASIDTTLVTRDLNLVTLDEMSAEDVLSWEYVYSDSLFNYQLQLDDNADFTDPIEETITVNKKESLGKAYYGIALNELADFDSLVSNTRYYWRVKPNYNYRISRYPAGSSSFIFDPIYSAPSPVSITVEANYVTLTWGTGKEEEKSTVYNVYSSDNPNAVFPSGWTLIISNLNATEWTVKLTAVKKFYCVTAAGSGK